MTQPNQPGSLTKRQRQILRMYCDELGHKEIAAAMGISPWTVNKILQVVRRRKLGLSGRGSLKLYVRANPGVMEG